MAAFWNAFPGFILLYGLRVLRAWHCFLPRLFGGGAPRANETEQAMTLQSLGRILDSIKPDHFPENERKHADHVLLLLQNLRAEQQQFRNSVSLFEHASVLHVQALQATIARQTWLDPSNDPAWKFRGWTLAAARDAVLTVYHFRITLSAVRSNLKSVTRFMDQCDHNAHRSASRLLDQHFPKLERMRHTIAHFAEHFKTPLELEKHMSNGVYLNNSIDGNRFMLSRYRDDLCIELSEESAQKLADAESLVHSAFEPML